MLQLKVLVTMGCQGAYPYHALREMRSAIYSVIVYYFDRLDYNGVDYNRADNVFSLRRKELFWQYRLGTFLPRGLNERAADVELDMFACGMA